MNVGEHPQARAESGRRSSSDLAGLLVRLLRHHLSRDEEPVELPRGPDEWDNLLRLARRHHVLSLVHAAVRQIDSTALLPQWRELHRRNAARNLQLTGELFRLLDEFRSYGIPAIPFKGLTLAARLHGDVSLRETGDLDVLVRREDIVRAVDLLIASGHRPIYPTATAHEERYLSQIQGARRTAYLRSHSEHHLVCDERLVNVDLHWTITLREFAVRWDLEGIWNRAMHFQLAGREVPCLSDEDLILVLCANGAKDGWDRLDRVCDIAALLDRAGNEPSPTFDWPSIFERARRAGMARMLAVGLHLARELLGEPLFTDAEAFVSADAAAVHIGSRLWARLLDASGASSDSRPLRARFHLQIRERWRDRVRYCMEHLRPGVGDWAALPLPRWLGFLHYPIRPLRLVGRYGVELFRKPATPPSGPASASKLD